MTRRKITKEMMDVPIKCVELKAELGRLGLFKTMQKMEAVVESVGWEVGQIIRRSKGAGA